METREKVLENKLRRQCMSHGLAMRKSRKKQSINNFGQYMLIELSMNNVVEGAKFDMTLEDIQEYLAENQS